MRTPHSPWQRLPGFAVGGSIVWLVLVSSRLTGLTHLTLIDLLFLLAPLVIAPLGLALIAFDEGLPQLLLSAAIRIQPVGALLAVVAFLLPIGLPAAILAAAWLLVCAIAALGALAYLVQGRSLQPVRLATAAAIGFMAFGAIWLVLSRAGIAPIGLSPIIVEMTAVHFHFTGFAATLMAALLLTRLRDDRGVTQRVALAAALLLVAGSPVLAMGWATPVHVLQVAGAILVATGVVATAAVFFFKGASLVESTPARTITSTPSSENVCTAARTPAACAASTAAAIVAASHEGARSCASRSIQSPTSFTQPFPAAAWVATSAATSAAATSTPMSRRYRRTGATCRPARASRGASWSSSSSG